jgi:hypothetical protein
MKAIKAAIALALLPAIVLAHAGGRDIRGTIAKVEKNAVTVKRGDGVQEAVPLVDSTTYHVGDTVGQWSDMHVGSRVVVHIAHNGNAIAIYLPARK